jgi:glucokinase
MKESDFAAVISEGAITRRTPICTAALNLFVSVLGSVAGNLALTGMATGGVYLGGGIPPRILSCLKENGFMAAFIDKGRFKGFMERIAVRVILNDRAALLGAAQWALDHLAGRS